MTLKFKEPDIKNLPVGSHEPCRLVEVKRREPSEENLKKWPDMRPSWGFKFELQDEAQELNGHSGMRFCNESESKLGNLYQFVVDLNGGREPEEFDPADYIDRWFRVRVRKKPDSDKLFVQGVDPISAPDDSDSVVDAGSKGNAKTTESHATAAKQSRGESTANAGGEDDENDPF